MTEVGFAIMGRTPTATVIPSRGDGEGPLPCNLRDRRTRRAHCSCEVPLRPSADRDDKIRRGRPPRERAPNLLIFIAPSPQQYFRGMDHPRNDPAEALLRTYSADGGINYLDAAATLPSRPAIDEA